MLYLLLYPLTNRFALFNVFRYPSFRIISAFILSLVLGMMAGPWLIRKLREAQQGVTNVREDTPDAHQKKAGTPTMGGAIIVLCTVVATILLADLANRYVWTALTFFLGFGAIGFLDDWLKVSKKNSKGLPGRMKLLLQTLVFIGAIAIDLDPSKGGAWPFALDAHLTLPFVGTHLFNWDMRWLYLPFAWIVVVGTSHGVNLTDGLDGLAIGPSIVSATTFTMLAYIAGASLFVPKAGSLIYVADYLYIPHVPAAVELAVFASALAGASLAFLWYNSYPASVFMGDLGSLAIGGGLGALAILTKNEVVSAILNGVFLVETLSVMIQVFWFKRTGKRVFLRAPIHHHYELAGWAEPKIIVRFWITSILLAGVALVSLKLR
jgi:phospho-N-acetylmuramoyl-pentapeptide-transferase